MNELASIAARILELEKGDWTDAEELEWYELAEQLIRRLGVGDGVGQRRTVRLSSQKKVDVTVGQRQSARLSPT